MMHGRNNGKKLMAVRIIDHAFEIVSETLYPLRWISAKGTWEIPMDHTRRDERDGRGTTNNKRMQEG